ncbi:TPA: tail fiber assembly protein [Citrobacter freundii]|nr:tail fiber assembly protein [Escherichia coli]HCJ7438555.1 tail fiber assembly protein [Citrobacter freundii]
MSNKQSYVDAGMWPENGTVVSADTYYIYGGMPPEGKVLSADKKGNPVWADAPKPTKEELIQAAEYERQRLLKLADATMLDWRTELMLGEISDANREKLSAWLAYKNDVKSVDVTTDPEHVSWPVPLEA